MKLILTTLALLASLASVAQAQSASGLLTGPVSYVSNLTSGNPYGDNTIWTLADNSICSASGLGPNGTTIPNCFLVKNVVGTGYSNLQASDGTSVGISNCYTWDVWQLIFNDVGYCQTSFHGGGSGETRVALYCGSSVSSDMNGYYNLSCNASWDGTAITVINGVDTPIPTIYTINVNIRHHSVSVWIPAHFRTPRHLETWQQIDSMSVGVTPQPSN